MITDNAYVLHGRAYRNTSMIVDMFTQQHGRIGLVARGAKRPNSDLYSILQPFRSLFISWGGRGELKTLYSAESLRDTKLPELHGEQLFLGFYVNELMARLLHHDEAHSDLYMNYQYCLQRLAQGGDNEASLRNFELALLDELGYGVNLRHDYQSDEEVIADKVYVFHPERGVTQVHTADVTDVCVHGDTLLALSEQQLKGDRQRNQAKLLLRAIIEYHLDGRPLKTRELFSRRNHLHSSE